VQNYNIQTEKEKVLKEAQEHFTKTEFPDATEKALEEKLDKYIEQMDHHLRCKSRNDFIRANKAFKSARAMWDLDRK
jgi:hypothetical protein